MSLRLDWCSHAAVKYAVQHWHYSQSLPTPPLVRIGVWEDERFIGCVLFSRGANNNIGKTYGLGSTEVAELTRIALAAHDAPVSRVIRFALKLLRQGSPGLRLIVSYADPSHSHHGGVYQASGWLYLGQSKPSVEYIAPDGKQWHGRMVSASGHKLVYGRTRSVWRHDQCQPVSVPGKHKYALPLDSAMRTQIALLAQPYPKRATSIVADAPAIHAGEGGSTPTVALQNADGAVVVDGW